MADFASYRVWFKTPGHHSKERFTSKTLVLSLSYSRDPPSLAWWRDPPKATFTMGE